MIVIVESSCIVAIGVVDSVIREGPEGTSTCRGVVVGDATSAEYVAHLRDDHGVTNIDPRHGPYYYKVAVD